MTTRRAAQVATSPATRNRRIRPRRTGETEGLPPIQRVIWPDMGDGLSSWLGLV